MIYWHQCKYMQQNYRLEGQRWVLILKWPIPWNWPFLEESAIFTTLLLIKNQKESAIHIRRFQEYSNHINILITSSTLQFLQFWYQNGVNNLFLIVKSIEVTSGFISKVMKKFLGGATVEIFDI